MSDGRTPNPRRSWPVQPSRHARTREEGVLIAGGPVEWPSEQTPVAPDLAHIRERMPSRLDRSAYLVHSLRFFEDVLAYAEQMEAERGDA